MRYAEHPAPPPLDRWVKCYWVMEDPAASAAELVNHHGHRLVSACAVDMFPHTAHAEALALFEAR